MKKVFSIIVCLFCLITVTAKEKEVPTIKTNFEMVTDVKIENGTATTVVTLAKAKKQLRLETSFNEEDELIQDYIEAAIKNAENFIGGNITDKNYTYLLDGFDSELVFEAFPIKSITSIKYWKDETKETMPDTDYKLTALNQKVSKIRFTKELPNVDKRFDAVEVVVNVGMATIEKPIQQAILLMVSDMYERREDRGEVLSLTSYSLLRPYKLY